jgi:hypothetical protein
MKIPLGNGRGFAVIDDADYPLVKDYTWCLLTKGYAGASTYVDGKRTTVYIHRIIMGNPSQEIDHINCNKLDNRRTNLRVATPSNNQANKHKRQGCTSRFKGVYWDSAKSQWHSQIKVNQKSINLGSFDSEADAALAYNKAALHYFGEFARINIIEEGI